MLPQRRCSCRLRRRPSSMLLLEASRVVLSVCYVGRGWSSMSGVAR
jgi:hypothetical protein